MRCDAMRYDMASSNDKKFGGDGEVYLDKFLIATGESQVWSGWQKFQKPKCRHWKVESDTPG